jgi:serine/threonine-protein kinase
MMEYFEGETLRARLDRTGAMSVVETGQIVAQIASALDMAHETGLVHRDLKPENIFLVKPDGKLGQATPPRATALGALTAPGELPAVQVKVLDFGIAKRVGAPSATLTQTGYFLGTPYYCAPEQVFGGEVDARADIYSLGATAFEMLTGSPPFVGAVPHILLTKTTEDAPDLLVFRAVPAAVAHTITRMLARERDERPPSMAWVLEQLASWLEPGAAPVQVASAVTASQRIARTSRAGEHPTPPGRPVVAAAAAIEAPPSVERTPESTSQAMRAFVPSRGRIWRRAALVIVGVVASAGALLFAVGASSSRSTGESPRRSPPAGAVAPAPASERTRGAGHDGSRDRGTRRPGGSGHARIRERAAQRPGDRYSGCEP